MDSVLHGLRANAHQLGQLLARILPETSKFFAGPDSNVKNDNDRDNPGNYYAEALSLHQQYSASGKEELALNAVKSYNKVCVIKYMLKLCTIVCIGVDSNLNKKNRFSSLLRLPNCI